MIPYDLEYSFSQLVSAVLAVSSPSFLRTCSLLTGEVGWGAEKTLLNHCSVMAKMSQCYLHHFQENSELSYYEENEFCPSQKPVQTCMMYLLGSDHRCTTVTHRQAGNTKAPWCTQKCHQSSKAGNWISMNGGKLLTDKVSIMHWWWEHFCSHLNHKSISTENALAHVK